MSLAAAAVTGATGTIALSFTGLATGKKYMGSVVYGGSAGVPVSSNAWIARRRQRRRSATCRAVQPATAVTAVVLQGWQGRGRRRQGDAHLPPGHQRLRVAKAWLRTTERAVGPSNGDRANHTQSILRHAAALRCIGEQRRQHRSQRRWQQALRWRVGFHFRFRWGPRLRVRATHDRHAEERCECVQRDRSCVLRSHVRIVVSRRNDAVVPHNACHRGRKALAQRENCFALLYWRSTIRAAGWL